MNKLIILIVGILGIMTLGFISQGYASPDTDAKSAWGNAINATRDPFSPENNAPKVVASKEITAVKPWVSEQYTYPNGDKTIIREVPFPGEGKTPKSITPVNSVCPCGPDCDCWKDGGCGCSNGSKKPKKTSKADAIKEQEKWKGTLVQNIGYGAPPGYPGMYYGGAPGTPGNGCNGGGAQMIMAPPPGNGCQGGGGVQMYTPPVMMSPPIPVQQPVMYSQPVAPPVMYQPPVYQQNYYSTPPVYHQAPPVYNAPQPAYYQAPGGSSSYSSYRGPFRQWSSGTTQGGGGVQTYGGGGAANCATGN